MTTLDSIRPRSQRTYLAATLGSFAVGQAALLVSAIIRIPIMIDALGSAAYGLVLTLASAVPWLLVTAAGLRQSTRSAVASATNDAERGAGVQQTLRHADRISAVICLAGVPLAAVGALALYRNAESPVTYGSLLIAALAIAVLSAGAQRGAVGLGVLDATERNHLSNGIAVVSAVTGVVLTLLSAWVWPTLLGMSLAATLAATLPFLVLSGIGPRAARRWIASGDRSSTAPERTVGKKRETGTYSVLGLATLALYGVDLLVVTIVASPLGAAQLGLAQRLAIIVTAVPAALGPLLNARALKRGAHQGPLAAYRRNLTTMLLLSAAAAALLALLLPTFASVLSNDEVAVGFGLAVAVAVSTWLRSSQELTATLLAGRPEARLVVSSLAIAAVIHVPLSIVFTRALGAAGPPVSSTVAMLIVASAFIVRWAWQRHTNAEHEPRPS